MLAMTKLPGQLNKYINGQKRDENMYGSLWTKAWKR